MRNTMRVVVLVTAGSLGGAAPAAHAATVSYDPGTGLRIAAAPGERNVISGLTDVGSPGVLLDVTDTGVAPTAGPGCAPRPGTTATVRCVSPIGQGANLVVTVDLGDGDDTYDGTGFNLVTADQFITAGAGNDTVQTGRGFDAIDLGPGNDTVSPSSGNDDVKGGDGDDVFSGGPGSDTLDGGPGRDTLDYQRAAVPRVRVFLDGSQPTVKLPINAGTNPPPLGTDVVRSFNVLIGTENGDDLVGTTDVERIEGRGGRDRIFGDPAAFAADSFRTRAALRAACCFTTTVPSKTSPGGQPNPALVQTIPSPITTVNVQLRRGDELLGGLGPDLLFGSALDDDLNGEAGEDLVRGNAGADRIFARDGEADDIRCGDGVDGATVDLRDEFDEDRRGFCENVDSGALGEGRHVVLGPARPTLSKGLLTLTAACPSPVGALGCRGTLHARAGGRSGAKLPYRIAAGRRAVLRLRVPAGGSTVRVISVERGRLGAKTTIRTLRR